MCGSRTVPLSLPRWTNKSSHLPEIHPNHESRCNPCKLHPSTTLPSSKCFNEITSNARGIRNPSRDPQREKIHPGVGRGEAREGKSERSAAGEEAAAPRWAEAAVDARRFGHRLRVGVLLHAEPIRISCGFRGGLGEGGRCE